MDPELLGDGVVLRLWTREDKPVIADIVAASREEFDAWIPGMMSDLTDLDDFIDQVTAFAAASEAWYYGIEVDGEIVGQCNLNDRGDGVGEFGYWVRTDRTGHGIAARAVVALSGAAGRAEFSTLIIRCDAGNHRSAAVARKAGFTHVDTVELDPERPRTHAPVSYTHLTLPTILRV